MVKTNNYILKI